MSTFRLSCRPQPLISSLHRRASVLGSLRFSIKARRVWVVIAREGDHYKLAFVAPGTWSQKYNLVWDKVLGFNLSPKSTCDVRTLRISAHERSRQPTEA
jgi:hypothetical protein